MTSMDFQQARLYQVLNAPSASPASSISLDAAAPVHAIRFAGKLEREANAQPSKAKQLLARILANLPQWILAVQKFLNKFGLFKVKVTKADQTIEELLKQERPSKIDYRPFERPSKGVAKSTYTYQEGDKILEKYKDWTYLNILESIGTHWDEKKIARDALQNFYDGQGQKLDDTKVEITGKGKGKTEIKVSASATFDPDDLLNLGATNKKREPGKKKIDSGGRGLGAKDIALCLLRDYGAETVTFRSGEWQIDFALRDPGEENVRKHKERGLHVKMTLLKPPIQGNELVFTTTSNKLVNEFKGAKDLFYHSEHPDFKAPTYANAVGGFKLLKDGEEAHFYHIGQRREVGYGHGWKALDGLHIWTNEEVIEENDRDRTAFFRGQVEECLERVVSEMNAQEAGQAIQLLKEDWFPFIPTGTPMDMVNSLNMTEAKRNRQMLLEILCRRLGELTDKGKKDMPFELPKGLFTAGNSPEQARELMERGFIPVDDAFRHLGVVSQDQLVTQLNINGETITQGTTMTPTDKTRIDILKKAVEAFKTGPLGDPDLFRLVQLERALKYDWVLTQDQNKDEFRLYDSVLTEDSVTQSFKINADLVRNDDFAHVLTQLVLKSDLFPRHRDAERDQLIKWLIDNNPMVSEWRKAWEEAKSKTVVNA